MKEDVRFLTVGILLISLAALPPSGAVRAASTCSPEFLEVMEARAWEGAQREITQNANIIPRADSVLQYSCFDDWLDHLATYAANHFPGDPDESDGILMGGLMTDVFIVLPDDLVSGVDPNLTEGFVLYALLEILVLDQLVRVNSATGTAQDLSGLFLCGGKQHYLRDNPAGTLAADNFQETLLGNRGVVTAGTSLDDTINNSVSDSSSHSGCARMNEIWQFSKCYDFARESSVYDASHVGDDHDGFYRFGQYVSTAGAGDDYRKHVQECAPPSDNLIDINLSAAELACIIQQDGTLSPPSVPIVGFSFSSGFTFPGGGMSWSDAENTATPAPGGTGAMDVYDHFLGLVSGTTCASPVKVGYIVTEGNKRYVDAVCPNPGCYFTAPSTVAGNGTCTF